MLGRQLKPRSMFDASMRVPDCFQDVPEVLGLCARMVPVPKVPVWLLGWFWYGFWVEGLVQVPGWFILVRVLVSGRVSRGQG